MASHKSPVKAKDKKRDTSSVQSIRLPEVDIKIASLLTIGFFVLQLVGIYHHEPWRDEYQAFQIALNSHSLTDLFHNIRYEGHPAVWHLLLFFLTLFTENLFAMQLLHIVIITTGMFILYRYAPFSLAEKILISIGYFFFYEYAQISRSYAIGILCVICICAVTGEKYYRKKLTGKQPHFISLFLLNALFLSILANSSVYGLALSLLLSFYLLFIVWDERKQILKTAKQSITLLFAVVVILLSWILCYIQISPSDDSSFELPSFTGTALEHIGAVTTKQLLAFFPFPQLSIVGCWNTSFFLNAATTSTALAGISVLAIVIISFGFIKSIRIFALYFLSVTAIGALTYYTNLNGQRYAGHFFVALFICYWLTGYVTPDRKILPAIPLFITKWVKKFSFISIMSVQALAGLYMYYMDFNKPFSNCKQTGEFILSKHFDRFPLIGSIDYVITPLSYYTGKPVYTSERQDTSRFIIWDKKRNLNNAQTVKLMQDIIQLQSTSNEDTILFCCSSAIAIYKNGQHVLFEEEDIDESHRMKKIISFDSPCMVKDENYYVYLAWKKK